MPYRYSLLLGAWLAVLAAPAARAQELVRRFAGSVVLLTSGDTLRGPLTLYSDKDIIMLRQADGSKRTLTPWLVRAFAVKGELTSYAGLLPAPTAPASPALDLLERDLASVVDTTVVRLFISYRPRRQAGLRPGETGAPGFYEMLCEGSVSLVQRESLRIHAAPEYSMHNRPGRRVLLATQQMLISNFFLFTPNGLLTPLRRPRRDLAELLPRQAPQLEQYAALNRFDYTDAAALRAIVRYANNLLLADR